MVVLPAQSESLTLGGSGKSTDHAGHLILIVDDFPDMAKPLALWFTYAGFSASVAYSGRAAIESIRRRKPDLVLLDLLMPDLNGIEVLRWLRNQAELHDLPVIIYSSCDDELLIRESMEAGANEALLKGTDFLQVLARMQHYLLKDGHHLSRVH